MKKILAKIKHEIILVIPPTIFFFVSFQIIAFTRSLMLKHYGIEVNTFVAATIAALIVGKVVLVADHIPFINRFPEKPLIYNVVWKTVIYVVAAFIVRYVEHLFSFVRKYKDLGVANQHLVEEVSWPRFWAIQIGLLVLFLVYCSFRELIRVLGRDRVIRIFFGPMERPAG
jgi:hypothetical protein